MARILDQVVGHQESVSQLLEAHRNHRLASTWIFSGPSGVGKKKVAMGLAQALTCTNSEEACGSCGSCLRIEKKQSENLLVIEPSGVNIKIEQAREVLQFVNLQKIGKARVIIIDEAQAMNAASANALLKTLEEPPESTYFILLVRSLFSLLPTIRSRSQILRFSGLSSEELKKIGDYEEWVLSACGGSAEQAELLSGEGWAETRKQALHRLRVALSDSPWKAFDGLKDLVKDKETALFVSRTYQKWLREVLVVRSGGRSVLSADEQEVVKLGANLSEEHLEETYRRQQQLESDIMGNVDRVLALENFFLQLEGEKSVS